MTGASSSSLPEISLKNGILWLTIVCLVGLVQGSPYRSKNKVRDSAQLVYDQKQTGDYNIQLHLKDFQIIALLGDDTSVSGPLLLCKYFFKVEICFQDYEDYSYDYADFTVKPSSTSKPSTTTSSSTTLAPPSTTSSSSTSVISTTKIPSSPANNSQPDPSIAVSNLTKKPESNVLNVITESDDSTTAATENAPSTPLDLSPMSYSAQEPQLPLTQLDSLLPGKIKVQIVEDSSLVPMSEPALGIVPGEDVHPQIGDTILQGEISSYRRCGSGYARDKKGRCRRVRKPSGVVGSQLP